MIRHVAQIYILGGLAVMMALLGPLMLVQASPSTLITTTVVIGSASVMPGESTSVPLEALDVPGGSGSLAAVTIDVVYNADVVNITSCNPDPGGLFAFAICNTYFAPDTIRVTLISPDGVSGDLLLSNLTFQAVGAAGEASTLHVPIYTFADTDGLDIPVSGQDGSIEILSPTPTPTPCPDSDGDGWCDSDELYMGTDPNVMCAATPDQNDEAPPDSWPIDFNDDRSAALDDVIFAFVTGLAPAGLDQPAVGGLERVDLFADGFIDLQDVIFGYVITLLPTGGLDTVCAP